MKIFIPFIIILFVCSRFTYAQDWQTYPYSPLGSLVSFPVDEGKHSSLATKTEWWYINLHLIGSAPAYKQYDVMLCYFSRPANMRIFNIADPVSGIFHTDVNQSPFAFFQKTNYWDFTYKLSFPYYINDYSKWTYPDDNKTFSYVYYAESTENNDELNVKVTSNRKPMIVGGDGFMPIGEKGDSSFYYSLTNMKVEGSITFSGIKDSISSGIAWIDRQYGPFTVGINTDNLYEWYSLQLDKPGTTLGCPQTPSEFNVWQIYNDSNSVPYNPQSRLVSGIYPDNSQDTVSNFIFERTGYWYDTQSLKYFSQGWRYINPLKGINLDIEPAVENQVINVNLFKFWEGSTTIKGTVENQPVDGLGFAELVAAHDWGTVTPSIPTNLMVTPNVDHYSLTWNASISGTFPIAGYRIYRSTTNDGHWTYLATTTNLSYNDTPENTTQGYYYTISSFDNQTATSASDYANAIWVDPLAIGINSIVESNVKVYPNPASNILFVESIYNKNTTIEIINSVGQIIKCMVLQSTKNQLDIKDISKGIYTIKVINENEIIAKKLIV